MISFWITHFGRDGYFAGVCQGSGATPDTAGADPQWLIGENLFRSASFQPSSLNMKLTKNRCKNLKQQGNTKAHEGHRPCSDLAKKYSVVLIVAVDAVGIINLAISNIVVIKNALLDVVIIIVIAIVITKRLPIPKSSVFASEVPFSCLSPA